MPDNPNPGALAAKLAEVMAAVGHIPKGGHNTNFNYDFVRESDVLAKIRSELSQRKIAFIPVLEEALPGREVPTRSGTIHITEHTYRFDFIDGDTGQVISGRIRAEGMDGQDKGANKALTAAVKYFLLKTFLIPTGDDPDADEKPAHVETRIKAPTNVEVEAERDRMRAALPPTTFGQSTRLPNPVEPMTQAVIKDMAEQSGPIARTITLDFLEHKGYATWQDFLSHGGDDAAELIRRLDPAQPETVPASPAWKTPA